VGSLELVKVDRDAEGDVKISTCTRMEPRQRLQRRWVVEDFICFATGNGTEGGE
jgi:hypothetical protein